MMHELKCWPDDYAAVMRGTKRFEVRRNDRGFRVGDVLWLREYEPDIPGVYTGRGCQVVVQHIMRHDAPVIRGVLAEGFVVMSMTSPVMLGDTYPR